MYLDDHHGDGRVALWIKATLEEQQALIEADPKRYFVPPYTGPSGWVGALLLPRPRWPQIQALVEQGYRMVAGVRLVREFDALRAAGSKARGPR